MFRFAAIILPFFFCVSARADDLRMAGVYWGVMPIARYTTDQGYTVGAFAQRFDYGDPGVRPYKSLLTLQISGATRAGRGGIVGYDVTGVGAWNLRMGTEVTAFHNPYAAYYGLGSLTTFNKILSSQGFYVYTEDKVSVRNYVRKNITDNLYLETGATLSYSELFPSNSASQFVSDFGSDIQYLINTRLFFGALLDKRDSELIPSQGYLLSSYLSVAPEILGSRSFWMRSDTDFRYLFPLVEDRWLIWANHLHHTYTSPMTPVTDKARLGSRDSLRGLPLNRFLSNHSVTLRTEIRSLFLRETIFHLPFKGGAGLFLDSGRIGEDFPELFKGKTHAGWGFSVFGSYFTDDFMGSADFGFSEDGMSFYVGLGLAI